MSRLTLSVKLIIEVKSYKICNLKHKLERVVSNLT